MRRFAWNINDKNGNEVCSGIITAESQKSAREELIEKHNVDLSKQKVVVSSERLFDFEDNQMMWDTYFNGSMEEWDKGNRTELEATVWTDEQKMKEAKKLTAYQLSLDKATPYNIAFIKKKQSLQQYKPIVLQFEEYVGKSFNDVTAKDMEEFRQVTDKPQPDRLEGLRFNKDDSTTINVNGITIFADDYEMVYGTVFVIVKFYKRGVLVANVSLFGSGEHKKDEVFVIDELGHLNSETSFRVMKESFE